MRKDFIDVQSNQKVKTTDLTGKVFNKFLAINFHHMKRTANGSKAYWTFRCNCGKDVVRDAQLVKRGRIKSCGCSSNIKENSSITRYNLKNKNNFRTYTTWLSMINRCYNKNASSYKNYGNLGITVCDKWKSFDNFFKDMGIRPDNTTLDRIDVYGNYELHNCRWADIKIQSNNKRDTFYVTYNNEILSLKQCVEKYSSNRYDTVWKRLKSGWDLETALLLKPDKANKFIKNCIDFMDEEEQAIYINKYIKP